MGVYETFVTVAFGPESNSLSTSKATQGTDSRLDASCQRSASFPTPGCACNCILNARRTGKTRKREKKGLFMPWRTVVDSLCCIFSCSLPLLCFHHSHLVLFYFLNHLLTSPGISPPRYSKDFFHKYFTRAQVSPCPLCLGGSLQPYEGNSLVRHSRFHNTVRN